MKELVTIQTDEGDIVLELDFLKAPRHASNFRRLVKAGFYDGMFFHRLVPGFLIQIGDPNTRPGVVPPWGPNDSGYTIPHEIVSSKRHVRGVVNAARQDTSVNPERESSGSQFCIFLGEGGHLDGDYTIFGEVVEGMDVADRIAAKPRNERDFPKEFVRAKIVMGRK